MVPVVLGPGSDCLACPVCGGLPPDRGPGFLHKPSCSLEVEEVALRLRRSEKLIRACLPDYAGPKETALRTAREYDATGRTDLGDHWRAVAQKIDDLPTWV